MRDRDKELMKGMGAPVYSPAFYRDGELCFGLVTFKVHFDWAFMDVVSEDDSHRLEDCAVGEVIKAGTTGYYDDDEWIFEADICEEGECGHGEDEECPGEDGAIVYLGVPFASANVTVPPSALRPATPEEAERWVVTYLNDVAVERAHRAQAQASREEAK